MKRALLILLCSTALGLRATTLEEERRFVRESVEWILDNPNPKKWQRWRKEIRPALNTLSKDVRMSVYCELLAENMGNLAFVNHIIPEFLDGDGFNVASAGNAEALGLTRKVLEAYGGNLSFREWEACRYLALKGDESDLEIINKSVHKYYANTLSRRIAGTNLVCHFVSAAREMIPEDEFSVVPSVANTGPQGAYVEAILRQCWDGLEVKYHPGSRRFRFKDSLKIPTELLTMVVWFDEDGNPACNVDLGKYGLSMPTPDMLAQSKMPPPANRFWWYVSCIPCLLALLLWAKARRIVWAVARALRNPLFCVLRCAVLWGAAWVCCRLSCMAWGWTEYTDMETVGPNYYSGFPIWLAHSVAHGSVGGGTYVPVREFLNTAVWFMFWLFVRGLLTGRIIGSIPVSFIPIRRRIVFCLLMGLIPCIAFLAFLGIIHLRQKWPYWCTLVAIPVLIVGSLKWLRTGHILVFCKIQMTR